MYKRHVPLGNNIVAWRAKNDGIHKAAITDYSSS